MNGADALLEALAVNLRLTQIVLEGLDPQAWRAKPAGGIRTIAAIFSHVHNIRRKWVRLSAPHIELPPQLSAGRCTQAEVAAALAASADCCQRMAAEALAVPGAKVKRFHRDGWAKDWQPGVAMVAYMITHEAHHRGQVVMMAHQLGLHASSEARYGIWNWEKLWRECGFDKPR